MLTEVYPVDAAGLEAFDKFFDEHQPELLAFVRRRMGLRLTASNCAPVTSSRCWADGTLPTAAV